jgi:hypothetical protein
MRLTLELNDNQAELLADALTCTLQALVFEETQCLNAVDHPMTDEQMDFIQNHLKVVQPQRVLIAEILHTIKEAEKKTSIITQ